MSWWNYREVAELLQDKYRVILPILDGHAGSDNKFVSIEQNARRIIQYIDENHNGSVLLIAGLSLGGQILTEILSQRRDICRFAVIESALVIPMKTTNAVIGPSVGMSFGLIKKRWFSKMQFASLKIKNGLFEDYYRDACAISKDNMISFLKANSGYSLKSTLLNTEAKVCVIAGAKEQKQMLASARMLHEMLPDSKMLIFDDWYHGEASINHAEDYVKTLSAFIDHKSVR